MSHVSRLRGRRGPYARPRARAAGRRTGGHALRLGVLIGALTLAPGGEARADAGGNVCAGAADGPIRFGFYAFFAPVSHSADTDPASPGFARHEGYEADLLTALEAMDGPRLAFDRRPVADWPGIWLLPHTAAFDMAGGGITILPSRTLDADGRRAIAFTSGHVAFRQSLLTRREDAERLASYDALTADVRVGVLRDTTGEARLLQIAGLADGDGTLAAGATIETPTGAVVADGTTRHRITAAFASPTLGGRTHIHPPGGAMMPQVVYLGDERGEEELLDALGGGAVDAVARGEIGNLDAAARHGFAVAAVDSRAEYGGFTVNADDPALRDCIDERLAWLTDNRRIGYGDWRANPDVFLTRADLWNARAKGLGD